METQSIIDEIIYRDFAKVDAKRCRSFFRKVIHTIWLLLFDLAALILAGFLSIQARFFLLNRTLFGEYRQIFTFVIIFIISVFAVMRMYPGIGISPPNEIRKLSLLTSAGMALISIYLFVFQLGLEYSRSIFLLFWIFALLLLAPMRLLGRRLGIVLRVWGEPVAIIGYGQEIQEFLQHLKNHRLYGFVPVILVDFDLPNDG